MSGRTDPNTPAQTAPPADELAALRAENARLRALLAAHGIAGGTAEVPAGSTRDPATLFAPAEPRANAGDMPAAAKLELFARLFQGRTDIHAVRWTNPKTALSGYSPACGNEWVKDVCAKPRIKCSDCPNQRFLPLTDAVLLAHLRGRRVVGVYAMHADETCRFVAVDLDGSDWREDVQALAATCTAQGVPHAVEVSRSGDGAHLWIFFSSAIAARQARALGSALISETCRTRRSLKLASYDRLFPSQDTMPRGGFGNLIALPLQREARARGASQFVDPRTLAAIEDQWGHLSALESMSATEVDHAIARLTRRGSELDVALVEEDDAEAPWRQAPAAAARLPGNLPERLTVTLADQLYIAREGLPQPLANRLYRLAAFRNPEFHKAQAMRLPVWDKPRIIGCAQLLPRHLALPRGCLDDLRALLAANRIALDLVDARPAPTRAEFRFEGTLRPEQTRALEAMLAHEFGVLSAPTAFGKTVTAAAIIAARSVSTLVLVHRAQLLTQWRERLASFLGLKPAEIGVIGAGRRKPNGRLDIAVMQSLVRKGEVSDLVRSYSHIVVDECHHLSAFSFESLLRTAPARYVLGLTATPVRRDGQHSIIFMQCGPIRHTARASAADTTERTVVAIDAPALEPVAPDTTIQQVLSLVCRSDARNAAIVDKAVAARTDGRHVLLLTERTEHLELLRAMLGTRAGEPIVLHGRLGRREREARLAQLQDADPSGQALPPIVMATGRLIGEGFDHAPLNTLILAMPIAWKGTLQQYAGRLHRRAEGKTDVRIIDWVDRTVPVLERMWLKRQAGYRAMGYRTVEAPEIQSDTLWSRPCEG